MKVDSSQTIVEKMTLEEWQTLEDIAESLVAGAGYSDTKHTHAHAYIHLLLMGVGMVTFRTGVEKRLTPCNLLLHGRYSSQKLTWCFDQKHSHFSVLNFLDLRTVFDPAGYSVLFERLSSPRFSWFIFLHTDHSFCLRCSSTSLKATCKAAQAPS